MIITAAELSTFESLPSIVSSYAADIPVPDLDRRRSADAWTVREHLYHLCDVQPLLLGRMELIRDTERPVIEPYFPENEKDMAEKFSSIDAALAAYAAFRLKQLELIRGCSAEQLSRNAEHREYTRYSIPLIVRHMIFHEYWHMYRIEELWLTRDEYFR